MVMERFELEASRDQLLWVVGTLLEMNCRPLGLEGWRRLPDRQWQRTGLARGDVARENSGCHDRSV